MPVATITNRIISSDASRVLNPVTIRMPPTTSTVAPITAHTDDCGTPRPARVAANAPSAMSFCRPPLRSEEHTSELQSPDHLVCRLLLEKKKKDKNAYRLVEKRARSCHYRLCVE